MKARVDSNIQSRPWLKCVDKEWTRTDEFKMKNRSH